MYRGRLWTMRQFAGFGSPEETNARYHFLLKQGQGGLSVAFDMPTLMGRDSDDPRSEGEVGRCGVATDSLADFETLFDGIPLDGISTSMTISGPATILFAFFLAAAEKQGVPWASLDGTLQTDILKEYIAQKEWIFPPRPHLRLIGDLIAFCAKEVPKFHPISVSGYHIREAGSTAQQELAFTLAVVLGGTQSLHTNALDEVVALPTGKAAQIALRTQQVIAYETGVANVIDPLGGSYFVEAMTDRMEDAAEEYFGKISEMGHGSMLEGMLVGVERGYFQSEI